MADTVEKVSGPGCLVDEQSFINLNQRVCDLEALTDEDDQQISLAGNILTLEDGGTVDLSVFLDNTDDQQISIAGNILTLEDGGTVDLSIFLDNTDDQQITDLSLSTAGVLTLSLEDGGTQTVDLTSLDTDDQRLLFGLGLDGAGNVVSASLSIEDGNAVDITALLDNTDEQTITAFALSPAGVLTLTIENGNTVTVDLSSLDTDTDDQTLSIAGTLLTIADGNSVDLSAFLDNTDEQTLTGAQAAADVSGTLAISGGNSIPVVRLTNGQLQIGGMVIGPRDVMLEVDGDSGAIISGTAAGITTARTGVGTYTVSAPSWRPFALQLTPRTSDGNTTDRDNKKIQYRQISPTSYEVTTTVDDNGTTADPLEDEHFILHAREYL